MSEATPATRAVARQWFDALGAGRIDAALELLDPDVEFVNYSRVPGYNTDMPWIGTYRGRDAVLGSFKVFTGLFDVRAEECVGLVADGDEAMGVIHEIAVSRQTGVPFEIEFVQRLTVRNGKITRWKSYTDPSQILRALHGDSIAADVGAGAVR